MQLNGYGVIKPIFLKSNRATDAATSELTLYILGSDDTLDCLVPKGLAVIAEERRDEPSDRR